MKGRIKKRCMAQVLALVMMCILGACGTSQTSSQAANTTAGIIVVQ